MQKRYLMNSLDQISQSFANEWNAIFKDRGAILILLIAVWIYPLVYSIAYQNNVVREIPVTVVDQDKSGLSRQLIRMIEATQEIKVISQTGDFNEAEETFWDNGNKGVIVIPADFEKKILRGEQAHLGLYCDAGYFLIYKETLRGTLRASGTLSAGIEIKRLMAAGLSADAARKQRDPLVMKSYVLYNPAGSYGSYVMPGLILIILQQTLLVGIGMIGGARREKQNKLVSSVKNETNAIILSLTGRSLAYFAVSSFNLIFAEIILYQWFGFPDKGALLDLWLLMIPFLFSVIFMGLTVSLLMRRREHSIMMLVFLSPVILFLSGMSWPSSSLPHALNVAAYLFPSTSMIPAFLRIRTMGASLPDVRHELMGLIIQMVCYGILTIISYKVFLHRRNRQIKD